MFAAFTGSRIAQFIGFAVSALTAGVAQGQVAPRIYYTNFNGSQSSIRRANLDGTGVENLITSGLLGPWPIVIDQAGAKMYWGDVNQQMIGRADLNGGNVEIFSLGGAGVDDPGGLAIDAIHGDLYWTDFALDKISRTNLLTHGTTTLVNSGLGTPFGIDLDLAAGKMYWVDAGLGTIKRANLNGTDMQTVLSGLSNPRDLALDVVGQHVFWLELSSQSVFRANLDGTSAGLLIAGAGFQCNALAVDSVNQKLYWTSSAGISRANLDGSSVQLGIVPSSLQYGIDVLPEPASLWLVLAGIALQGRRRRR